MSYFPIAAEAFTSLGHNSLVIFLCNFGSNPGSTKPVFILTVTTESFLKSEPVEWKAPQYSSSSIFHDSTTLSHTRYNLHCKVTDRGSMAG